MDKYIERDAVANSLNGLLLKGNENTEEFVNAYNSGVLYAKERILEYPAADVQPKSQWISVDDSLPEEHKCVLVCEDGRVCTAWIHKGEWDALGTVTYWQPLPEPPKEE